MAELTEPNPRSPAFSGYISFGQGVYYLLAGLWPLVSISSFQRVTGPKTDLWLVKTVGSLVSVVGLVLAVAGLRRRFSPEVALLGAASAATLAAVDLVYGLRGRISPIYLLDAVAELALVAGWVAGWLLGARQHQDAGDRCSLLRTAKTEPQRH